MNESYTATCMFATFRPPPVLVRRRLGGGRCSRQGGCGGPSFSSSIEGTSRWGQTDGDLEVEVGSRVVSSMSHGRYGMDVTNAVGSTLLFDLSDAFWQAHSLHNKCGYYITKPYAKNPTK